MDRNKRRTPLIFEFRTRKGNKYIYDICSNLIFYNKYSLLSNIIKLYPFCQKESISKKFPISQKEKVLDLYLSVDNLVKHYDCFFPLKRFNQDEWSHIDKDYFKTKIANVLMLVLEVTQNCNFRCDYCSYSGNYFYQREHTNKDMSFEIAKDSLDYFISLLNSPKRTRPIAFVDLAFYGGEPLLNMKLIKGCVNYIKSRENEIPDEVRFQITTNGSLLKGKILDYLVSKEFKINISLDGPSTIHDLNRKFKNGKGTFDKIWENINLYKKKYPKHFKSNTQFLITFSKEYDLEELDKFFNNDEYFTQSNLKFSNVNVIDRFIECEKTPFLKNDKFLEKSSKTFIDKAVKNRLQALSPLVFEMTKRGYKKINQRIYRPLVSVRRYSNTCFPGEIKIFVAADGNYHICERMNQKFPIGDHKNGIEYEKVERIVSEYINAITKDCPTCPAQHYCGVCFASAGRDGYFDASYYCNLYRKNLLSNLSNAISVLEKNSSALDYIE